MYDQSPTFDCSLFLSGLIGAQSPWSGPQPPTKTGAGEHERNDNEALRPGEETTKSTKKTKRSRILIDLTAPAMKSPTLLGLLAVSWYNGALGFAPVASRMSGSRSNTVSPRVACLAEAATPGEQRRDFLGRVATVATSILLPFSSTAAELPSVTSAEFDISKSTTPPNEPAD